MARPKAQRPTYSLTRRGKRYYVQWRESGGPPRRVSCGTENLEDAKRFLADFRAGRDAEHPPETKTIGAIVDGYLASRRDEVHSKTIDYDCQSLKRHLGDLSVDLLDETQVKYYWRARRKEGAGGAPAAHRKKFRPLSNGTLIRELGTLRAALNWAVREKWILHAPHVKRPPAPESRNRWITRTEADRLLEAAHAPHIRLFISLALYTAARAGALKALTWAQVDLANNIIALGKGNGKKRRATVPIITELRQELEQAREIATTNWVIEFGGKPVGSIKTGFRAAVRRAGLTGVTPHVLRHTAATWMVQRGVSFEMIAKFLGDTVQMVEKVYGHHSPEWLRQAAEALSRPVTIGEA